MARAHYWHRFFSHQPDLNYESAEVQEAMIKVVDFWLGLGVDGLRLDAVPYLYEQEGTNCENLPQTHAFLKRLRAHVDENYADRMLLAEANQWPEDAVAYFGQGRGDECHMAFHFPLMPRLFMAVRMEDRTPIVDILEQTPPIPETSQWALFLRNHDELTLEMVTDEERDYMYRMYAHVHQARLNLGIRRRLAPLLGNDRKRLELLNGLLLSLPGTPVLYYGDEIGMGDNIYLGDRNGVRTPMQWSADRNAGFSRANPQQLYLPITLDPEYHYEAVNVEAQLRNPHSLLWWMRRVLALRKGWRALGEGRVEFLAPQNRKILAYVLRHEQETLLVVANLSRFPQPVELDLSAFKGRTPVELFGRTPFPSIGVLPFLLTRRAARFLLVFAGAAASGRRAKRARGSRDAGGAGGRAALGRGAFRAADASLGKGVCAISTRGEVVPARGEGRQVGQAAGGGGSAAGVSQGFCDALAGGICRSGSGVVCGASGLCRGRRSRAVVSRRTPACRRGGDNREVGATRGAVRCAGPAGVRHRVARSDRAAAAIQGPGRHGGGVARAAAARAGAEGDGGFGKRVAARLRSVTPPSDTASGSC